MVEFFHRNKSGSPVGLDEKNMCSVRNGVDVWVMSGSHLLLVLPAQEV